MTDEPANQPNGPTEPLGPESPALPPASPGPSAESASPSSDPAGESRAAAASAAEVPSPSWPPAGGSPAPDVAAVPAGPAGSVAAPSPGLASIVVVDVSGSRTLVVATGDRLVVGADERAAIRVIDPRVGPQHALIVRQGPGWLVSSLDPANPIWMLDATGRPHPVLEELGLRSGTLLAGATQLLLYPPAAG